MQPHHTYACILTIICINGEVNTLHKKNTPGEQSDQTRRQKDQVRVTWFYLFILSVFVTASLGSTPVFCQSIFFYWKRASLVFLQRYCSVHQKLYSQMKYVHHNNKNSINPVFYSFDKELFSSHYLIESGCAFVGSLWHSGFLPQAKDMYLIIWLP